MKTERRARQGPPARRATARLAMLALALSAIGLGGCQSLQSVNPFRNCNPCGPIGRLSSGIGNRLGGIGGGGSGGGLFHRNRARMVYDEPPIVVDPAPGVEVVPGTPIVVDPGTTVGAPLVSPDPSLNVTPRVDPPADELNLSPLPEPTGRAPQDALNSKTSSLTTPGSRSTDRGPEFAYGASSGGGDPYADRMARRSSDVTYYRPTVSPTSGQSGNQVHPLFAENLPEIDRIPESTPPASAPDGPTATATAPAPEESPPAPPPAADAAEPEAASPAPPPPEPATQGEPTVAIPEPRPESGAAPGIAAFSGVEPLLAGGSVPTADGWATLVDRGYRTVLDLRPIEQVAPADVAASSRVGLRHVLLPTTPGTIDAALVRRFEDEIAQEPARPLFFCDADGATPAALWFIHLVEVGKYDAERARRDAGRIAPIPGPLYQAALAYLDARNGTAAAASAPPSPASATLVETAAPAASVPVVTAADTDTVETPVAAPTPAEAPAETSVAEVFADPFAKPAPADPKRLGPYAAFFLTILVVPLAYWGSLGIPAGLKTRVRASLSAPARRPPSLPAASGDGT